MLLILFLLGMGERAEASEHVVAGVGFIEIRNGGGGGFEGGRVGVRTGGRDGV